MSSSEIAYISVMAFTISKQTRDFLEQNLSLAETINALILTRQEFVLADPLLALIAERFCKDNGLQPHEDDVDAAITDIRKSRKLFTADETESWLAAVKISDDALRDWARKEVLIDLFKKSIAGVVAVERYFSMNRMKFDEVELYRIVCKTQGTAKELKAQIMEGESFFELAHNYSTEHATRAKCGYLGRLRRDKLVAELESQAFSPERADVIGPLKVASNYHLYKVEGVYRAELTEEIQDEISELLLNEWLQNSLNTWLISQGLE